ncbi:MAG: hypothetical protein JKX71_08090 [Amylibacter sp.]|nr:hypothetical protein [Amylibacter sp.]
MEIASKVKSENGHKVFSSAVRFFRTTLLILLVSIFAFGFNLSGASTTMNQEAPEIVLAQAPGNIMLEQSVASHSTHEQLCSVQIICHAPILLEIANITPPTSYISLRPNFSADIAAKGLTVNVILPPPLV